MELGDHAQLDVQDEQVAGQPLDRALRQAKGTGDQAEHDLEAWPNAPRGVPGESGAVVVRPHSVQVRQWGWCSTSVGPMGGTSVTWWRIGVGGAVVEGGAAAAAGGGLAGDGLVELAGRDLGSGGPVMFGLSATFFARR